MEQESCITLEPFNEHYILVYGNQKAYSSQICGEGGEWFDKLDGWLVPVKNKSNIELIANIARNTQILLQSGKNCARKSADRKYHRAMSDDERGDSDDEGSESEEELVIFNKSPPNKRSRRSNHSRKNKFTKSPVKATVVRVKHRSRGKVRSGRDRSESETSTVSKHSRGSRDSKHSRGSRDSKHSRGSRDSKHSRGSRRNKLKHTDSYTTKRPTRIVTLTEKLLNSDSSSDSQEDSDDSDFPDSTDPRDHEKEYRAFLKKQARIARRD
jgi:hypothetical protein